MKQLSLRAKWILPLVCMQILSVATMAQVKYHAKDNLKSEIKGTSTLHDWSMQATKGECNAVFTLNPANQLTGLTFLSFTMPVESLKSEKTSMDKNAYKALKADQNPSISYHLTSASVAQDGSVKCLGKLTIAGATVDTELMATAKLNQDKSIAITGSKKISMKDFNIAPPSFMLGTIKTGNDITLKFDVTLARE
ncbi:MAG: YceI family protein [Bacteroidota bacterium]